MVILKNEERILSILRQENKKFPRKKKEDNLLKISSNRENGFMNKDLIPSEAVPHVGGNKRTFSIQGHSKASEKRENIIQNRGSVRQCQV